MWDRRLEASRAACPLPSSHDPSPDPSRSLALDASSFSRPRQPIALDLLVEIAARHLQCARGLRHVPVVLLELAKQKRSLGRLLELFKRGRAQPGCIAASGRRPPRPPPPPSLAPPPTSFRLLPG